ncbi:ubiquinol oxidase subunit II [Mesorhizobium sp. CA18]|uniref:ubiquinol oxidase subunit II n=1 Tax=unclassified Mesorhizobium TaxID=325217 RepID=UPI001CC956EB|nr:MULTISPECIES: ubiquinol oxidase subunit II [unclassified Mesorhizobium]MBZ9732207.1 ubiquinol oxidase subunit II [Mesorhizobium sp. CA9]MBZ9824492.1 ubiquinol oxidase subunit II [Mesorhizobium sp. CA18]MBZ9829550.1 ubiquinol oxidase subunit II [Mesorhizobium sp. CA2]MBZ9837249.1 ubiquinol oxidase subunit II [Mesorhizobium sp. CA3]MBZ9877860.1 ubiquinol oxidase subunit II [Mesorhizobium sp. Ca11]
MRRSGALLLFPLAVLLSGCDLVVLAPAGDVAAQQRDLLVVSTLLMLIIILPVMALTVLFAWRYRQSSTTAIYTPDWDHSTKLELVIWAAPLLVIICLGALTWLGSHLLDPYRRIDRIEPGQPVTQNHKPLRVDVVALDWKWLFIYPDYGIASVNELAAPVNQPIDFRITSSTVMNSFYIPALAGQIYAMPAMVTKLHAVINRPGTYSGFSANYSGAGFSGMRFAFHGLSDQAFGEWVTQTKGAQATLSRETYLELERPSENEPVRHYASVDPDLYGEILNLCVERGKMCMNEMMSIDAKGGLGLAGVRNTLPLQYDKLARRGAVFGNDPSYVASICTAEEAAAASRSARDAGAKYWPMRDLSPLRGAGLLSPGAGSRRADAGTPSLGLLRFEL